MGQKYLAQWARAAAAGLTRREALKLLGAGLLTTLGLLPGRPMTGAGRNDSQLKADSHVSYLPIILGGSNEEPSGQVSEVEGNPAEEIKLRAHQDTDFLLILNYLLGRDFQEQTTTVFRYTETSGTYHLHARKRLPTLSDQGRPRSPVRSCPRALDARGPIPLCNP